MKPFDKILLLLWVVFAAAPASGQSFVDLEKEAATTEIPSAGGVVITVLSGSTAEEVGLKEGDYVVSYNEKLFYRYNVYTPIPPNPRDNEFVYVTREGVKHKKLLDPGGLGVYYRTHFRPELAYLRGRIGRRSPSWDEAVTLALHRVYLNMPEEADAHWKKAKQVGYEGTDALYLFTEAFVNWANGRGFETTPVIDAIVEQHDGSIPHEYFPGLERLALASNSPESLERMRSIVPANNTFEGQFVEGRIALKKANAEFIKPNRLTLLERARNTRRREITKEFLGPAQKEMFRRFSLSELLDPSNQKERSISSISGLNEGVKNLHVSLQITTTKVGLPDKYTQMISFKLMDDKFKRDPAHVEKSGIMLAFEIRKINSVNGMATNVGGSGFLRPQTIYLPYEYVIPMWKAEVKQQFAYFRDDHTPYLKFPRDVDPDGYGPEPIDIDLIRINGEAAAFCNGVSIIHMPVSNAINDVVLGVYTNLMTLTAHKFNVWELE